MLALFRLLLSGLAARGRCLALLLGVHVSRPVCEGEYLIQKDALAAALRDGLVVRALSGQVEMATLI
jgi:hypothetical protein